MRIFWRTLAVLGGVVVLLLIAVAVAVHSVDVTQFIGPIQQRVKAATGRDLEVHGGIALKLGLEPKLVLDDVTLGNAPWGKQPQMLMAKQIEAQIALLPLLRKRFEVVSFKLISPTIALETDAGGKGNWVFPALPAADGAPRRPPGQRSAACGRRHRDLRWRSHLPRRQDRRDHDHPDRGLLGACARPAVAGQRDFPR